MEDEMKGIVRRGYLEGKGLVYVMEMEDEEIVVLGVRKENEKFVVEVMRNGMGGCLNGVGEIVINEECLSCDEFVLNVKKINEIEMLMEEYEKEMEEYMKNEDGEVN